MPATILNIKSPEAESSEEKEHNQKMAELGDKITKEQEEIKDQRLQKALSEDSEPSDSDQLFAGKYRSAGDLEKAYLELQRKLGERTTDDESESEESSEEGGEEPTSEVSPEPEDADESDEGVQELLSQAMAEFDENLELTSETIDKLAQLDPKEMIQAWADSTKALREQVTYTKEEGDKIMAEVGGEQAYGELIRWAADNLSPQEIASYDAVVNTNNADAIRWAVQGLKARYEAEYGSEGTTVTGGAPQASNKDIYRSLDEMTRDMADPRYESDPAFRADVMAKLGRSGDLI